MEQVQQNNGTDFETRLKDEVSLLHAMYPEQIEWQPRTREIKFCSAETNDTNRSFGINEARAMLVLRLPDDYLSNQGAGRALPTIISANDYSKLDLRTAIQSRWQALGLTAGEEILDQIILDFQELVAERTEDRLLDQDQGFSITTMATDASRSFKTTIIWLHHLLATGKRKLALHPTQTSGQPGSSPLGHNQQLQGLTKPGYPGIMIFSGPADMVDTHVAELKAQRWQAFQIKFEASYSDGEEWKFEHDGGIREVESMSEVVSAIRLEEHKEEFLKAVGVK